MKKIVDQEKELCKSNLLIEIEPKYLNLTRQSDYESYQGL